jgi:4-carboxymuconolactone decarboxylase
MKSFQTLASLLLVIAAGVAPSYGRSVLPEQADSGAGVKSSPASVGTLPKDIYPDSGNRLPPVKREELDEIGKKLYDARGSGGFFGPGGIQLYSPPVADYQSNLNDYLRHKSGLDPRLLELAILVTAREMDVQYVWTVHEPTALKAGLEPEIIDTVKYRKPVTRLGEKEAIIILLGRGALGKHKVGADTFARALKAFGNQGLVNLVTVMGDYASIAILLNTFDQHVRPADKPLLPIP